MKNDIINRMKKVLRQIINDKVFIKRIFSTALTRALAALGTLFLNFVLARRLGISYFGDFRLAYSILIGLSFLAKFGTQDAALRFSGVFIKNHRFGEFFKLRKDFIKFIFITSLFLSSLFILFRNQLVNRFFDNTDVNSVIIILAISLPFYSYLGIQSSYLKAFRRPQLAPFFEIGLSSFYTAILVELSHLIGIEVNILLVGFYFMFSVLLTVFIGSRTLVGIIKKETLGKSYEINQYTGVFKTLPDFAMSGITIYLLRFSPVIIMGAYTDSSQIGLYSVANSIALLINFLQWIINAVYAPYFSNYYFENKIKKLKRTFIMATFYMLLIAFPLYLIIISFPREILSVFGEEYQSAYIALIILASAQLFNTLTGPVYFMLGMTGHERSRRNIIIITAVISLVSSFILIPRHGLYGATIATAIGLLLQNSMAFFKTRRLLKNIN